MAESTIALRIITPRGVVLDQGNINAVYIHTLSGSMGFLPNHSPLIAALVPHVLRYEHDGEEHRLFVSNGVIEVLDNQIDVLTSAAEGESEIDFQRAQAAHERALERLRRQENIDTARAEAALNRAKARLSLRGN